VPPLDAEPDPAWRDDTGTPAAGKVRALDTRSPSLRVRSGARERPDAVPRTRGSARERAVDWMRARLELLEPGLVDDLIDFLRRRECAAEHVASVIEVELPLELGDERARMELELLLRVWQALHGGAEVQVSKARVD
jgi:hypothetical protein